MKLRSYNLIVSTGKIGIQSTMMYKGNFFLSLIVGFISLCAQIIFWPAVYGVDVSKMASYGGGIISGYTLSQMLAYSILVYILQFGNSTVNIGNKIKSDIMSGDLNSSLIRPFNYLYNSMIFTLAKQIILFFLSVITMTILVWAFKDWVALPENIMNIVLLIPAVFMAYTVSFLISCILGLISFWILETSTLDTFLKGVLLIMSGAVFPLDYINGTGGIILKYLPFSYITFFPTQLYLAKSITINLFFDYLVGLIWVVVLLTIVKKMWSKGIRKYSAYGG